MQSAFAVWGGAGGEITFNGDSNNDGVADDLAWLLGASGPQANSNGLLPWNGNMINGALSLNFKLLKSVKPGSATVRLQYSRDLGVSDPWASHAIPVPESRPTDPSGVDFVITPIEGSDLNQVQVTVLASVAAPQKQTADPPSAKYRSPPRSRCPPCPLPLHGCSV